MGRFRILKESLAAIPTPAAGYVQFAWDTADGLPKYKDETGAVSSLFGATEKNKLKTLVYDVVNDYGGKGDLKTVPDGAVTNGNPLLTCATSAPFVLADVGKRITLPRAGAANATLTTTIASFVSATQVNLTVSPSSTVSSIITSFGTDDTTAVQNAINAAQTAGGGIVWFGGGTTHRFGVTSTITVTGNGVQLWGPSGAHTSDIGDYTKSGSAWLCWWAGSAPTTFTNGILLQAAPVQGASNPALTGFGVSGLSFDCRNGDQNGALIGVQILSAHGFFMRDFYVIDASAVGIDTNVVTTLGEARDCTRWLMERGCIRELDNPAGAVVSGVTTSSAVTLSTTPQSLTVTANALPAAGFVWIMTNMGYPVLVNYTGGGGTTTLTSCSISAGEAVNAPATINGSNVVQALRRRHDREHVLLHRTDAAAQPWHDVGPRRVRVSQQRFDPGQRHHDQRRQRNQRRRDQPHSQARRAPQRFELECDARCAQQHVRRWFGWRWRPLGDGLDERRRAARRHLAAALLGELPARQWRAHPCR